MTEQKYKAVLAVIADGHTVTQVVRDWAVARQTVHVWLERYEADGLEGLTNRSHRPARCPHQMPATVEAQLLEMRRAKPYWGARRLALELLTFGPRFSGSVHVPFTRCDVQMSLSRKPLVGSRSRRPRCRRPRRPDSDPCRVC